MKKTRKELFMETIELIDSIEGVETTEVKEFLEKELEKASRKSTRGKSKARLENERLAENLMKGYLDETPRPTKYFIGIMPEIATTSKATAVLKILVEDGRVTKTKGIVDGKAATLYALTPAYEVNVEE